MKNLTKIFLKGLAVLLPTVLTIYALVWFATTLENILGGALRALLPEGYYFAGMGLIAGMACVCAVGVLMNFYLVNQIYALYERLLTRLPLIKSLYNALKDLFSFFSGSGRKPFNKVVMVPLGNTGMKVLGFVTRDNLDDAPAGMAEKDEVAVYLPMSYQVGGYMVVLPRAGMTELDMSVDKALTFALTAGMVSGNPAAAPAEKKSSSKGEGI
ncbi:MAG TPA: DUF502 domain-containing protein [Candidatus Sumerlaeota bacterium]|nr:DUF502 domain-containing protein [Candidatus Sumerlaeota bacterium]